MVGANLLTNKLQIGSGAQQNKMMIMKIDFYMNASGAQFLEV